MYVCVYNAELWLSTFLSILEAIWFKLFLKVSYPHLIKYKKINISTKIN